MKESYLRWRYHAEDVIDMSADELLDLVLNYIRLQRGSSFTQGTEEMVAFQEHGKAVEDLLDLQRKGRL